MIYGLYVLKWSLHFLGDFFIVDCTSCKWLWKEGEWVLLSGLVYTYRGEGVSKQSFFSSVNPYFYAIGELQSTLPYT